MQIANFPKLAACLYPDALEEECLMMSYYHLWVLLFVFISSSSLFRLVCFRYSFGTTVQKRSQRISSILSDLPSYPELDCGPLTNDPQKALAFKKATDALLLIIHWVNNHSMVTPLPWLP
jgi:hypothetical protein